MKKLFGLTIAALLIIGMVGGGTWAYFSDPESSPDNSLTAGTLDLDINSTDAPYTILTVTTANPGVSGSGFTALANSGSLTGELDIASSAVTNTESVGATEYEADGIGGPGVGELGGVALIAIFIDVDVSTTWNTGDIGLKSDATTYTQAAPVTGTADSGSTTTLTDDALIQADDFFNGMILSITGGTGSGQSSLITDFVAATDTITVTPAFTVAIDGTSVYSISNLLYATMNSYASKSWGGSAGIENMLASATDNFYIMWRVPTSADNTIQGDSAKISFTFTLEQPAAD